jgi:hypothetical protein
MLEKQTKKFKYIIKHLNTSMKQRNYMRYHRYDQNNTKYIKRFELNNLPSNIVEDGYTAWTRGTGPHNPEALNNVQNGVRKACLGVPKSPEQREKMRLAKLGKPKTQEHKDNMRKSWERRRDLMLQGTHAQTNSTTYS